MNHYHKTIFDSVPLLQFRSENLDQTVLTYLQEYGYTQTVNRYRTAVIYAISIKASKTLPVFRERESEIESR